MVTGHTFSFEEVKDILVEHLNSKVGVTYIVPENAEILALDGDDNLLNEWEKIQVFIEN